MLRLLNNGHLMKTELHKRSSCQASRCAKRVSLGTATTSRSVASLKNEAENDLQSKILPEIIITVSVKLKPFSMETLQNSRATECHKP
jgi:hypothetical protein